MEQSTVQKEIIFRLQLYVTGFMAWQDSVKHYAAFLAEMGYVAFTFDFCGGSAMCGKSDGKTTEMSVLTETKDLKAVIEYVRNLSYTDSEKILLMGCSQGGFVSALVAAKNNFPIEKLVLFYPALCIPMTPEPGKMMMQNLIRKMFPILSAAD